MPPLPPSPPSLPAPPSRTEPPGRTAKATVSAIPAVAIVIASTLITSVSYASASASSQRPASKKAGLAGPSRSPASSSAKRQPSPTVSHTKQIADRPPLVDQDEPPRRQEQAHPQHHRAANDPSRPQRLHDATPCPRCTPSHQPSAQLRAPQLHQRDQAKQHEQESGGALVVQVVQRQLDLEAQPAQPYEAHDRRRPQSTLEAVERIARQVRHRAGQSSVHQHHRLARPARPQRPQRRLRHVHQEVGVNPAQDARVRDRQREDRRERREPNRRDEQPRPDQLMHRPAAGSAPSDPRSRPTAAPADAAPASPRPAAPAAPPSPAPPTSPPPRTPR